MGKFLSTLIEDKDRACAYLMALALIVFLVYFGMFILNAYNTFHVFSDLGGFAYNLYFNAYYPQIAHGLQLIAFDSHISPYFDLFLPIFLVFGGAPTLLMIQLLTLAVTGVVVFLVTKSLTRDSFLALIFGVVFLFYPGTLGMLLFGAHIEFPIPLFYILMFYFYVRRNVPGLLLASLLFIGIAEVTPILVLSLAIGLALLEHRYGKMLDVAVPAKRIGGTSKHILISGLFLLGLVMLVVYSLSSAAIIKGYEANAYSNLPKLLYITAGTQNVLIPSLVGLFTNPLHTLALVYNTYAHGFVTFLVYGIALVVLGFGITMLFVPDVAFVLILPWVAGVLLLNGDPSFVLPFNEYFSFVIGPIVCCSILGAMVLRWRTAQKKQTKKLTPPYGRTTRLVYVAAILLPALLAIGAPLTYLFVISPFSRFHTVNLGNINQFLLFQSNATQQKAYSQLTYVISRVPTNGVLMVDTFILPHVTQRQQAEFFYNVAGYAGGYHVNTTYAVPDYILVDRNSSISGNLCSIEVCQGLNRLLNSTHYQTYLQNGSAILYRRT